MQRLAIEAAHARRVFRPRAGRHHAAGAVAPVAHQRVPDGRHVSADLVRSPGLQTRLHQRVGGKAFAHVHMRHRPASARAHGLPHAIARIAPQREVDAAAGHHAAFGNRPITPLDAAREHGLAQRAQALGAPRHHEQAARVLVQTLHEAGAGQMGQFRAPLEQTVDQGAARIAGAGVDDHPRRLVDDDDGGVFVYHAKRDLVDVAPVFAGRADGGDADALAAANGLPRLDAAPVERGRAAADPAGEFGTRQVWEHARRGAVEALPAQLYRHHRLQLHDLGARRSGSAQLRSLHFRNAARRAAPRAGAGRANHARPRHLP